MTNPYGPPPGPPQFPPQGRPVQPPPGYGPPSGPQQVPGYPPQIPGVPAQQGPGMPPMGPGQMGPGPAGPGQMGPGPMGQPMAPPPPGMGRVVLDTSYLPLAFVLGLFKPGITINGHPGPPAKWGKTVVDLPVGQHQIQVHVNYLWKFGHATAMVPVHPGQHIDVYYRSPAVAFGEGAIGPVPQDTPNLPLAVVLTVAPVALAILMIILFAMTGASY